MPMSPDTSWDAALEQLTALPGGLQDEHGATNFMRAVRYRRNGRRLFETAIAPLLREGRRLEVMLGFVDTFVAESGNLTEKDGYTPASSEFLAARLWDADACEIIDVSVCAEGAD